MFDRFSDAQILKWFGIAAAVSAVIAYHVALNNRVGNLADSVENHGHMMNTHSIDTHMKIETLQWEIDRLNDRKADEDLAGFRPDF